MIAYLSGGMEDASNDGEITIAFHYNNPIYLINKFPLSQLSEWIISFATEIFDDFDTLKNILYQKFFNVNNRT